VRLHQTFHFGTSRNFYVPAPEEHSHPPRDRFSRFLGDEWNQREHPPANLLGISQSCRGLIIRSGVPRVGLLTSGVKTGFFEFTLQSEDRVFLANVELIDPGLEESEAMTKVPKIWEIGFGAPEVVVPGSVTCVNFRQVQMKPRDGLKIPRGTAPVLIWKSEEQ
jgi:hypothetical protein